MKKQIKDNKFINWLKTDNVKKWLWRIILTIVIICCTIALQYGLGKLQVKDENIFLIFVVAILIILLETKNIVFGIVSSFIFVMSFNFFDTEPYFSFEMWDSNYYISFAIFIVVSLIVGSLVLKLQKQNKIAIDNGKKVRAMYDLSSRLLDNHDEPFVMNFVCNFFKQYLNLDFFIIDVKNKLYGIKDLDTAQFKEMMTYCLDKNIVIGKDTFMYKDSDYLAFPIRSKVKDYGALFVNVKNVSLKDSEIEFIKKNILHLVVVLDREEGIKLQESSKVAIEKEKFKNQLLRSLSHDLKTPLTSIQSGSDLLMTSYDKLDDETKKELISDIHHESMDLSNFIVNLLNMSKLDEMKKIVNRKNEAVDDILAEVYDKCSRNLNDKTLTIVPNEELVMVYSDANLLETVLINLVNNAIKHTKDNTAIKITYQKDDKGVTFKVIDNGGGIKEANIEKIFEDFYSFTTKQDKSRSNGLGLSICRAIIEAHGGKISAINNDLGGATFTFNIPNEGTK